MLLIGYWLIDCATILLFFYLLTEKRNFLDYLTTSQLSSLHVVLLTQHPVSCKRVRKSPCPSTENAYRDRLA